MPTATWRRWIVPGVVVVALLVVLGLVVVRRPVDRAAVGGGQPTGAVHRAARHGIRPGNGVIVDGIFEEPNILNPDAGPTMTYSDIVNTSLFQNLYDTTPGGKILPEIATGMPVVSGNGLHYTFTLKHTEWSNGRPFTAADVVATWKLVTSAGYVAWSTTGWTDVASISVANPYKFTVNLKQPFPALVADCFATDGPGIVPASVFGPGKLMGKAANNAPYDHHPTPSNGPFMFKSWTPGVSITVVPNPHWFGPKPKAREIVYEVIPNENTLLADAQAHSINVYYFDSVTQVKQLQAIPGARVHFTTQPAWEGIDLNEKNPFLKNVKVRQALAMAIDVKALVSKVWNGHAVAIGADQPPDSYAYNPSVKPYPYDPAQAKKILLAQGFKMGAHGYLEKGGKEFTLVYSTTSGNPWRTLDQELIQFWFKQIGVHVVIKDYPANAYFGTVLPSQKGWDMGEFEFAEGYDPLAGMQPMFGTNGVNNYTSFSSPALDHLFAVAGTATAHATEKKDLQQAETIIHNQVPEIILYSPKEIDTSIDMTGYTPNPYMADTWNSYDWQTTS